MEKSKFIKGSEFDSGLKLVYIKMNKFTPPDPKYGVSNQYGAGGVVIKKNYFVNKGLLNEGESWKYYFKDGDKDREFDNTSVRFFFAIDKAKLNEGDVVTIKRNKKSNTDIEWSVVK